MLVLKLKKVILFLSIVVFSTFCFCSDDSAFTEKKLTADDGEEIVLRYKTDTMFLPYQDQALFEFYKPTDDRLLAKIPFITQSDLILLVPINDMLEKFPFITDNTLIFTKTKDYENVTLYSVTLNYIFDGNYCILPTFGYHTPLPLDGSTIGHYYNPPPKEGDIITYVLKIWIDKKDGTYSGSLTHTPVDLSIGSFEGNEYYTAIQDVLIDLISEEFNSFQNYLNNNEPHELDYYFDKIFKWITNFNPDTAKKIQKQLDELNRKNTEQIMDMLARDGNETAMALYSSPVSMVQEMLAGNIEHYGALKRPDFVGDVPKNSEELEKLKLWYSSLFGSTDIILTDAYGTPVLFEITEIGLKVTSAGADKEFDTGDDIIYINGVKQDK